jgi:regulator of protease activity HflC (stomatin/prohibitin superfamily)
MKDPSDPMVEAKAKAEEDAAAAAATAEAVAKAVAMAKARAEVEAKKLIKEYLEGSTIHGLRRIPGLTETLNVRKTFFPF